MIFEIIVTIATPTPADSIYSFNANVFSGPGTEIGMDDIDMIRRDLDLPRLPLSRIGDRRIPKRSNCVRLEIPEGIARKHGHFLASNAYKVHVGYGEFDRFLRIETVAEKNETGEVVNATIHYVLDEQAIVALYEATGTVVVAAEE